MSSAQSIADAEERESEEEAANGEGVNNNNNNEVGERIRAVFKRKMHMIFDN